MTDRADLKVGSFYWVMPVLDVDCREDWFDWVNDMQPARFAGFNEKGEDLWNYIGFEENDHPVRYIGEEIVFPTNKKVDDDG